jgi:hypothetical protein
MFIYTSCNDFNACTIESFTGSSMTCNVVCNHTPVTTCVNGDGCCPPGCFGVDSDCGVLPPDGGLPPPCDGGAC